MKGHGLRIHQTALAITIIAGAVTPNLLTAQATVVEGSLSRVWTEDPRPGREFRFFLHGADGVTREVVPDEAARSRLRPNLLGAGVRVSATVEPLSLPGARGAQPLFRMRGVRLLQTTPSPRPTAAAPVSYPYAWLLCRYADDPSTPFSPAQAAQVSGTSYPGAGHYYDELSEGRADLAGTAVHGWYTLPKTRSAYTEGASIDLNALTTDCVAAADADVFFPDLFGVVIQMNGGLSTRPTPPFDTLSFGGTWHLNNDGVAKPYAALWMSGQHAFNYVVVHHEMGHSFGWLHSSGPYDETYDSRWDIMSTGYIFQDPTHGWMGPHTIAYHKELLGWIPPERIWRPGTSPPGPFLLLRSALSPAGPGYQAAFLPILTSPGKFYTIEARRNGVGYDRGMPGDGVVIHRIDPMRPGDRQAQVVDPDNDGDANDAGAIWIPGERFADEQNGIHVSIDSVAVTGYWLTIAVQPPLPVAASCAVAHLLTAECLTPAERDYLDAAGNLDGNYDIGDLLAFLDREGLALSTDPTTIKARMTRGGTR